MKIRTQLVISMVVFGLALLIIAISMITTNQQVDRLNNQEALAKNIELQASELSYLSNDYLLYNEGQQVDRWNSKYASVTRDVSNLSVDRPEQQVLVNNIQENQQRLKGVFNDVVTHAEAGAQSRNTTIDKAFIQVSWSRIGVQTQGIVFDASRLSQKLGEEADQQKQLNNLLISALLGIFGAFLLINYFLIYRSTLKSIATLEAGIRIIGSGDLDFSIEEKKGDEFFDLSHAFNRMTAQLKSVVASKADLEKEVVERRRVEAELQTKHEELEIQAEELESQAEELRANNEELERQIKERLRAEDALKEAKQQAELYLDLMGHDISNMHQIVYGQLELAQEAMATKGKLDGEDKEYIDTSIQTLERSARLVDDVRKLQKLRAGEYRMGAIDLGRLLAEAVEENSRIASSNVAIHYAPVTDCFVLATPLLKDVFNNLIGNAIKHSQGPTSIDIAVHRARENGSSLCCIAIGDNGPGIPDAKKGEVFHRFKRGNTRAKGTGLGLYIVKTLVESFHGTVKVEDRVPGDHTQGSRFLVYLPAIEIKTAKE